jgi:hypothetical protein
MRHTLFCDEAILGDFNYDGVSNVQDIIIIINIILYNTGFEECGDLNSDGYLNILDVVQLANIILGT